MTIGDNTEANILKLIFNATAWANVADNAATTPQTNIGISLHTADPGEGGSASVSEIAYTSYTRVNVLRTTGGWTVTLVSAGASTVVPVAAINFPAGTGGAGTASFFATAKSNAAPPTGAQEIYFSGTVTPNIVCGSGVTPSLSTATTISLD